MERANDSMTLVMQRLEKYSVQWLVLVPMSKAGSRITAFLISDCWSPMVFLGMLYSFRGTVARLYLCKSRSRRFSSRALSMI